MTIPNHPGPPSWSPDYKSGAPLARLTEHDLIYVGDKCLNAHASKDVPPIINEAHAAALRAAFARGAEAMRDKYVAAFAHVPQVTVETLPLPEYRDHA